MAYTFYPSTTSAKHRQAPLTRPVAKPALAVILSAAKDPERSAIPKPAQPSPTLKNGVVESRGTLKSGGVESRGTLRTASSNRAAPSEWRPRMAATSTPSPTSAKTPASSSISPRSKARSYRHPERSEGSREIRYPQTRSTLTTLKNGGVECCGTLKNGGVESRGTLRMAAASGAHLLPPSTISATTPASSSNSPRRKARSCCHPERSEGSRGIPATQFRSHLSPAALS
jgi:hypothetical protein